MQNFSALIIFYLALLSHVSSHTFPYRLDIHGDDDYDVSIFYDLHAKVSKAQNIIQLKHFLSELKKLKRPTHLLIESNFFYNRNSFHNLSEFLDDLYDLFDSDQPFTFDYSPQHDAHTTWIAWELPLCLEELTLPNLSYDYCDPRLFFDSVPYEQQREISQQIENALALALAKYPQEISRSISAVFKQDCPDERSQLMDKLLTEKILNLAKGNIFQPKNIIVLCGANHAFKLAKDILPLLGLRQKISEEISLNDIRSYADGATISDAHLERGCDLLSHIHGSR